MILRHSLASECSSLPAWHRVSASRNSASFSVQAVLQAHLETGPFAGLLLADYGATVLRLDRAIPNRTHAPGGDALPPTPDGLVRRKSSIAVDIKDPRGVALVKALLPHVDVVIDPFRPGVLEKAGLGPEEVMMKTNPRLVVGRMTGFRRDGKYSAMAGHDINYIAVSGTLSMLGREHDKPYPPGNILGDFAGGGMVCFVGILLALLSRGTTGRGQVVEANMVDGSAILTTMPRLAAATPIWDGKRGTNRLDGGCPFYDTYETKDGKYMAVYACPFPSPRRSNANTASAEARSSRSSSPRSSRASAWRRRTYPARATTARRGRGRGSASRPSSSPRRARSGRPCSTALTPAARPCWSRTSSATRVSSSGPPSR